MVVFQNTDTHGDRSKSKFCFFTDALLKKEKELPTLNFLSRFLSPASFSTFAVYFSVCGEKISHTKKLAAPSTAKELKPSRITKTLAKKFFLPTASWQVLCFTTVLYSIDSVAQIGGNLYDRFQNHAEQFIVNQQSQTFMPTPTPYGLIENSAVTTARQIVYPASNKGNANTSQNNINQQNRQLMQRLGSEPPPTPEQIAKGNYYEELALKRELKQKELFNVINAMDNNNRPFDTKQLRENEKYKKRLRLADTNSVDYKTYRKCYEKSYNELTKMLSGKAPLNLKRAVFLVENPYYKNKLSYETYCKQIDSLVFICQQIMLDKGLRTTNYMACHYAIQKLFSEKVTYKSKSGKQETFEPLTYDLSIYDKTRDEADHTEQHVTKLLNIKMGQCHSMPLLYLILAEKLNANAYLALSPNHSYVKFGNQYQAYCFETTNGTFTSDQWIVSSGYVSATAIKNQIYLTPLTKEQVIAESLLDLEGGFEDRCGKSDFSIKCANTTLHYFPNSIKAQLVMHNVMVAECAKTANSYNFPKENEYYKYPELKKQFDEMVNMELEIEEIGYQRITDEQYEKWRKSANEEKQRREHLKLMSKLEASANEK